MVAPIFSADDYRSALQALLPRGRAWPRDPDAVQTKVMTGLAGVYQKSGADAAQLLIDAFPATANALLPEWEETMGLPDPLIGILPTLAARQAQVTARFSAVGGQSAAYFIALAAKLGYAVTINQFMPSRIGHSRAGDPLRGPAWAHTWQIVGTHTTSWASSSLLQAELTKLAPAHTILCFLLT